MKSLYYLPLLFMLSTLISCRKTDEYGLKVELSFKNDTNVSIEYSRLFTIQPQETKYFFISTESTENPNLENCCQGTLEDFQGAYDQVFVTRNETDCYKYGEDEGPTHIRNFEASKIGSRKFRYEYIFTDDSFQDLMTCQM